jgi:environmental stress-induced protein Ves
MPEQLFTLDQLEPMPWKNGGGLTREIVCAPAGASLQDFGWRISVAEISCSGAFSSFSGIDRSILLLKGNGVRLDSSRGGWQHQLDAPLLPFGFAGEDDCHAALLDGPTRDFNVMTRRGRFSHQLRVCHQTLAAESSDGLILVVAGEWRDQQGHIWHPGQGCYWQQHGSNCRLTPASEHASALLVSIKAEDA